MIDPSDIARFAFSSERSPAEEIYSRPAKSSITLLIPEAAASNSLSNYLDVTVSSRPVKLNVRPVPSTIFVISNDITETLLYLNLSS